MQSEKIKISNRIVVSAILGVLAVAFSLWYTASKNEKISQQKQKSKIVQQKNTQYTIANTDKDTDGDGLKDWEELLAGTDPNKKDTDGNGISDFKEVKGNIKIEEQNKHSDPNNSGTKQESSANTNLTDEVTKRIFTAYINAKQANVYDKDSITKVVNEVAQEAFATQNETQTYSPNDIKAIVKAEQKNAQTYYKTANKATAHLKELPEYELVTYARGVENKDAQEFAKLKTNAEAYRLAAQNLLVVPVPQDILQTHIDLINAFVSFADTLDEMSKMVDDPVLSFVHIRDFLKKEKEINDTYDKMRSYFAKYNIKSK